MTAIGAKRLAALKGYVADAWPLALIALVFVGYSAGFCSCWSRKLLSIGNVVTTSREASKDSAPPFNTNLLCCENELDKCCVSIHDGNTDFTQQEKLVTTSESTKRKQSYSDTMPKGANRSYSDMMPKCAMESYIDVLPKGINQSSIDMMPKSELQGYVDMMLKGGILSYFKMMATRWVHYYVDMLCTINIKTCVDMLPTATYRKQMLLLVYVVMTSLAFVIGLVLKRCRSATECAALTYHTVSRLDCATRIGTFEDMFNMRLKIFVHHVIRRNLEMKREARKNRKMLKHFAGVVRQVKEKKKGLRVILDRNTDLLVKMEEREEELHAINVDLKTKLKVLEGQMVTVGLRPEHDDTGPRNPVYAPADVYLRDGVTAVSNIRQTNSKSTGGSPQRRKPNP